MLLFMRTRWAGQQQVQEPDYWRSIVVTPPTELTSNKFGVHHNQLPKCNTLRACLGDCIPYWIVDTTPVETPLAGRGSFEWFVRRNRLEERSQWKPLTPHSNLRFDAIISDTPGTRTFAAVWHGFPVCPFKTFQVSFAIVIVVAIPLTFLQKRLILRN